MRAPGSFQGHPSARHSTTLHEGPVLLDCLLNAGFSLQKSWYIGRGAESPSWDIIPPIYSEGTENLLGWARALRAISGTIQSRALQIALTADFQYAKTQRPATVEWPGAGPPFASLSVPRPWLLRTPVAWWNPALKPELSPTSHSLCEGTEAQRGAAPLPSKGHMTWKRDWTIPCQAFHNPGRLERRH